MGTTVSSSCDPKELVAQCQMLETDAASLGLLPETGLAIDKLDLPAVSQGNGDGNNDNHSESGEATKRLAAVFFSGVFSPIQKVHIRSVRRAVEALRGNGYHVVGAYLSPSSPHYARRKLQGHRVDNQTRLALVEAMLASEPLLMLDLFECYHRPVRLDPVLMAGELETRLNTHLRALGHQDCAVFMLSGISSFSAPLCNAVVLVNRPGYDAKVALIRDWNQTGGDIRCILVEDKGKDPLVQYSKPSKSSSPSPSSSSSSSSSVVSSKSPNAFKNPDKVPKSVLCRRDPASVAIAFEGFPLARQLFERDHRWDIPQPVRHSPSASSPLQCLSEHEFQEFLANPSLLQNILAAMSVSFPLSPRFSQQQQQSPHVASCTSGLLQHPRPDRGRMGLLKDITAEDSANHQPLRLPFSSALIRVVSSPRDHAALLNEANFHLNFGNRLECVKIPCCYAAQLSGCLYLALEDYSPWPLYRFPSSSGANSPDRRVSKAHALVAIRDLARMHAHFWNDEQLSAILEPFNAESRAKDLFASWTVYYEMVKCGAKTFGADLSDFLAKSAQKEDNLVAFLRSLMDFPFTLLHSDLWLGDISFVPKSTSPSFSSFSSSASVAFLFSSFDTSPSSSRLALVEWRNACYGPGIVDLAMMLDSFQMAADDAELLQVYHDVLLRSGVEKLHLKDLQSRYRLAKRYSLIYHHTVLLDTAVFKSTVFDKDFLTDLRHR